MGTGDYCEAWTGAGGGIVLVIGVLVVPNVTGRRIAGRSEAAPIAAPPQVGDCLTWTSPWGGSPISASRAAHGADEADGTNWAGAGDRAATRMVPCTDPHQGEISQMAMDVAEFPVTVVGGAPVPALDACRDAAYRYLAVRSPTQASDRSILLGPWSPPSTGSFAFLSPDRLQSRAGQRWLACVLSSPQGEVRGAARGIYSGSARVNPLAVCSPGTNVLLDLSVPCTEPHGMDDSGLAQRR